MSDASRRREALIVSYYGKDWRDDCRKGLDRINRDSERIAALIEPLFEATEKGKLRWKCPGAPWRDVGPPDHIEDSRLVRLNAHGLPWLHSASLTFEPYASHVCVCLRIRRGLKFEEFWLDYCWMTSERLKAVARKFVAAAMESAEQAGGAGR